MTGPERISFQLPLVPHSLRAFIEQAVRDQRTMMSFVESPKLALQTAGVAVDLEKLTRADYGRLVRVLGKLRNLVAEGKLGRDFRFEEVFTIDEDVFYQQTKTETDSYVEKNFDHSTEGHDSEQKSSTEEGIYTQFQTFGTPTGRMELVTLPLISPGDLAVITTLMNAQLEAMAGRR
jgi:hypothetical protein